MVMNGLPETPAFVVDVEALRRNAAILREVAEASGAHLLLALKAFSMPAAFPYLYAEGTCASSVHETLLGGEFGGERHAFAAAFSEREMAELLDAGLNHVTLNSFAQLAQWRCVAAAHPRGGEVAVGLRINPEHSEGQVPIYDPCAPHSRLGIRRAAFAGQDLTGVTGLHCHNLCEQNADCFARTLEAIEEKFGDLLPRISWFNFGGGHHITRADYDVDLLCRCIEHMERTYGAQIYLEPGEAVALDAGWMTATVLDVVEADMPIAILDTSAACHMPDVLEMPYRPRVLAQEAGGLAQAGEAGEKSWTCRLAGKSCLAGDVIGEYSFAAPLAVGQRLIFCDMAIYSMVKTTTFNGLRLPGIGLLRPDGEFRLLHAFGYEDFRNRLS